MIHDVLTKELGYHVDFRVIDAKSFVPAAPRAHFHCRLRQETDFSFDTLKIPDPFKGPKLRTILHPGDGSEKPEKPYTPGKKAAGVRQIHAFGSSLDLSAELRGKTPPGRQWLRLRPVRSR